MKMPWWEEGNNGIVKERQKKWGSDRSCICKYIRIHEEKVIVKDFQLHLRAALSSCGVNIFLLSVWGFHSETGYTGLKGPLCSPGVKAKFSFVFFFFFRESVLLCLPEAVSEHLPDKDTRKPATGSREQMCYYWTFCIHKSDHVIPHLKPCSGSPVPPG